MFRNFEIYQNIQIDNRLYYSSSFSPFLVNKTIYTFFPQKHCSIIKVLLKYIWLFHLLLLMIHSVNIMFKMWELLFVFFSCLPLICHGTWYPEQPLVWKGKWENLRTYVNQIHNVSTCNQRKKNHQRLMKWSRELWRKDLCFSSLTLKYGLLQTIAKIIVN